MKRKTKQKCITALFILFIVVLGCGVCSNASTISIKTIENIKINTKQGQSLALPKMVVAIMSNNTRKNIAVKWNPDSVSTKRLGSTKYFGKVNGYAKKVVLTIEVQPFIVSVIVSKFTAKHNQPFIPPKIFKAIMSDNSTKTVNVKWSQIKVDTSIVGLHKMEGIVSEYKKNITIIVEVIPIIESVVVNRVIIKHHQSFALPETVEAIMSDKSVRTVKVNWISGNADTSTVGVREYNGNVEDYKDMVRLIVEIVPVFVGIEPMKKTIPIGTVVELPKTADAIMSDNSQRKVAVQWKNPFVGTATIGDLIYYGSVVEFDAQVRLTLTVVAPIKQIDDIRIQTRQNTAIALPATVVAYLSDNTNVLLDIKWNTSFADTSSVGKKEYAGTVVGYGNLVHMSLDVQPVITSIDDVRLYLNKNDNYILPSYVHARLSDNTEANIPVIWENKIMDTKSEAINVLFGTVKDFNDKVKCYIFVDSTPPVFISYEVVTPKVLVGGKLVIKVKANDYISGIKKITAIYNNGSYNMVFDTFSYSKEQDAWLLEKALDPYVIAGNMKLNSLEILDNRMNTLYFTSIQTADMNNANFEIVYKNVDISPPVLSRIGMNQTQFKVGDSLKMTAVIADDISGVKEVKVILGNNSSAYNKVIHLISTGHDNIYEWNYTVSEYEMSGLWTIKEVNITDYMLNQRIYKKNVNWDSKLLDGVSYSVINQNGDITAPIVQNLTLNGPNPLFGEVISLRAKIFEEGSGILYATARIHNLTGKCNYSIPLTYNTDSKLWEGLFDTKKLSSDAGFNANEQGSRTFSIDVEAVDRAGNANNDPANLVTGNVTISFMVSP